MAITKIVDQKYYRESDVKNLIDYAIDDKKTHGLIGGMGVNPCNPDKMAYQMVAVKRGFEKNKEHRQIRHIIVSFDQAEQITPPTAYCIAYEIAQFYGDEYQICFGVHQDTDDLHIHFIQNTVNYVTGRLFSNAPWELGKLKNYVNQVVLRYTHNEAAQFLYFLEEQPIAERGAGA